MKNKFITIFIVLILTILVIFVVLRFNGVFFVPTLEQKQSTNQIPNDGDIQKPLTPDDVYDSNKEAMNVYLFWGDGCLHCEHVKELFSEIEDEYGKFYNLIEYEVWNNEENELLRSQFGEVLNETPSAVPYLVIGNKSITGYKEEAIKELILEQYTNDDYIDVYDVINEEN